MAEGAIEVDTLSSSAELSASGGAGEDMELPAQLEGQLELHVDPGRDLLFVEGGTVQGGEDGMVTEPVLGMRMLMSSRVSCEWGGLVELLQLCTTIHTCSVQPACKPPVQLHSLDCWAGGLHTCYCVCV